MLFALCRIELQFNDEQLVCLYWDVGKSQYVIVSANDRHTSTNKHESKEFWIATLLLGMIETHSIQIKSINMLLYWECHRAELLAPNVNKLSELARNSNDWEHKIELNSSERTKHVQSLVWTDGNQIMLLTFFGSTEFHVLCCIFSPFSHSLTSLPTSSLCNSNST